MLPPFKLLAKAAARTAVGARLAAGAIASRAEVLCDPGGSAPTVLVLNSNRWQQDLEALTATGRLRLLTADVALLGRLHSLFPKGTIRQATEYFLETDPVVWAWRRRRVAFLRRVVRRLKTRHGIQAVMTPAIHYRNDLPWAEACEAEDLPFVAIHKEFTVIDERQLQERIALWRQRRFRFLGRRLCVTNGNAAELFREAGVVAPERMVVTGLMRIDNIARADSPYRLPPDPGCPATTLFSFGHLTGPFATTDVRSHYFSRLGNEGFVEMFRDVHVGFAVAALAYPGVRFRIKLKNHEPWWIQEIEAVLRQDLALWIADIPNLEVVTRSAPELIQESLVVIGLNSTVVLESRMLGRQTIIPVFAEAVTKYPDHVYFHRYLDQFAIAASKQDLRAKIDTALTGVRLQHDDPVRLAEMFHFYLGGDDGRAAHRVADVVTACVEESR
jgi:hypothetical protein